MTQITPNEGENPAKSQEQTHEERSTASGMLSDDSEMDHDAQERSARERLKKASLASMSKKDEQRSSHYGNELPEASAKNESSQPNAKQDSDQKRSSLSSGPDNPRAHDLVDQSRLDTIGLEREGQVADLKTLAADHEHHQLTSSILDEGARERRTDETSDNPAKLDAGRPEKSLVASVLPSETQAEDGERHLKPSNDVEIDLQPPLRVYNPNANSDEEKGTMSPRKKRSRDHLDAEVDREQKIAATEEARAQRFSNEAERAKVEDVYQQKPDGPDHARQTQKSGSIFGNTSQVKAPTPSVRPSSPDRDQSRIPTSNAFASSGFAALASSTASPFGAGASLVPARVGFADSTSTINIASDNAREERHVSGLADKTKTSGIADGHTDTPSVFGGQVFGQSFGNSAISAAKLSSFAAPRGDATFGGNINAIKPIGSTKPQDKDEADSGSDDGDIDNELGKEEGAVDADDRFYTQNGKGSICLPRRGL